MKKKIIASFIAGFCLLLLIAAGFPQAIDVQTRNAIIAYIDSRLSAISAGSGVTNIESGDGLTGGPITSSGTLAVNASVMRTNGAQTVSVAKTFTDNFTAQSQLNLTGLSTVSNIIAPTGFLNVWKTNGIYRRTGKVGVYVSYASPITNGSVMEFWMVSAGITNRTSAAAPLGWLTSPYNHILTCPFTVQPNAPYIFTNISPAAYTTSFILTNMYWEEQ